MASQRMASTGFSLLELLLSLALGLPLVALISQALLGELGNAGRLTRLLRERAVAERALELMRMELQEAQEVAVMPGPMTRPGCGLAGRTVLLHLNFPPAREQSDRDVTYSLEPKPDAIWRGQALMRCGPAYALDGHMSEGIVGSTTWLDSLDVNGTAIENTNSGAITIRLQRVVTGFGNTPLRMPSEITIADLSID